MKLTCRALELRLKEPFTIARGSKANVQNVLVKLEHAGIVGYGEAAPNSYYGQDAAGSIKALRQMADRLGNDPAVSEEINQRLLMEFPGQAAAAAAVDMALHDWQGKEAGQPLWQRLGLDPKQQPATSFTIGLAAPEEMVRKVRAADDYPILKVKLGTELDEEIVSAVRRETDKPIRGDANAAWGEEEALRRISVLQEYGLEFIEQPLAAGDNMALKRLRQRVEMKIVADESSIGPEDIPGLRGCVDGINIKLAKCGGISRAISMARAARDAGLKVMLGCMIESSVGISAAAQLAPLADYLDLDGNLLIDNDPATGVRCVRGRLSLSKAPGLGVAVNEGLLA